MDEELNDNDLVKWVSTYGVITAERILGKYQITLPQDELLGTLKSPVSFYHRILQVPLKNVLNGIVLQQANDYHVYVQKLFIDYLLSGETGKDETAQGASTRETMEHERNELVTLGEEYHSKKLEHDALIASSQLTLIKLTQKWNTALDSVVKKFAATLGSAGFDIKKTKIRQAINHAIVHCDLSDTQSSIMNKISEILKESLTGDVKDKLMTYLTDLVTISNDSDSEMSEYIQKSKDIGEQARSYRARFYDTILRVTTLINLLPEYKINPEQDQINRELLYFDKSIGEVAPSRDR